MTQDNGQLRGRCGHAIMGTMSDTDIMAGGAGRPADDYYPAVYKDVTVRAGSWGSWEVSRSGKWRRSAVLDDGRAVVVYLSGAVQDPATGIMLTPPPATVLTGKSARDLADRRAEKYRAAFVAGLVDAGVRASSTVHGSAGAMRLIGDAMLQIATNTERGRDAVAAAKLIGQTLGMIGGKGAGGGDGKGTITITGDLRAAAELLRAVRGLVDAGGSSGGASAVGGLVLDGDVRDVDDGRDV